MTQFLTSEATGPVISLGRDDDTTTPHAHITGSPACRGRSYSSPIKTFLYLHCSDLEPARSFYSGVLGLTETYSSTEEGMIGYQVGTLQISIATHPDAAHVDGWAKQPGWEGGATPMPSWGVELAAGEFRRAVGAALTAGLETLHSEPRWTGYWSFPLKDPIGNTVELSTPQPDAWPPPE